MTAELERVVAKIEADTSQYLSELKKAAAATHDMDKSGSSAFARLNQAVDAASKKFLNFKTVVAAVGGATGFLYFGAQATRTAEQLIKVSERMGITTKQLQELRFSADLAGISTESLESGLKFLSRSLGEASRGTGENRYILEKLGLVGADTYTAFLRLSDVFSRSTDATGKLNLSMQLLGRGGSEMIDLMNEGSGKIAQMSQRANQLGLVLSEDLLRRAAETDDELDAMFAVFKKISLNLAFEFLPVMKQVAQVFTDPEFISGAKTFAQTIGQTVGFLHEHGDKVVRVMAAIAGMAVFGRLAGAAGAVGGGILGALAPEAIELLKILGVLKEEWGQTAKAAEEAGKKSQEAVEGTTDELKDLLDPATRYLEELERQNSLIANVWLPLSKQMQDDLENLAHAVDIETEARQKNIDMTTKQGQAWRRLMAESARLRDIQRDVTAAIEGTRTEDEKLAVELKRLEELKPHLTLEVYQRRLEQIVPHLRRLKEAAEEMGKTIASSFENAVFSGERLSVVLQNLANDIARVLFRKTITEPLGDLFGTGLKGLFGLSSAQGNVFSGPVTPFARGGVVSGPRVFPMARGVGLMGEKGPEAIMPLRRTSRGDLGVVSEGAKSNVQVNVYAPPGSQVQQNQTNDGNLDRIDVFIENTVANGISRRGSRVHRALRDTFGLNQQGINR